MHATPAFDDRLVAGFARAGARFVAAPGSSWMYGIPKHDDPVRARPLVNSP